MPLITENSNIIESKASPFSLKNTDAYLTWRAEKLANYPTDSAKLVVGIGNLGNISDTEFGTMQKILQKTNMVIYDSKDDSADPEATRKGLRALALRFGLDTSEAHRSAGEQRIVALEVSDKGSKRGYIPYSNRPLNWHTDGYYNASGEEIGTFLLHCARDASKGGRNQLLDPEIAYIRLRDENPAYIEALSHMEAMTIPFNTEADGSVRPDSIGPVFSVRNDGNLAMRYTARTRSISWRDDVTTTQAVEFLNHLLADNEPLIQTIKMRPGQGVINNNVLHNRTGFENGGTTDGRLLYRIRFHQRAQNSPTSNQSQKGKSHETQ